VWGRLDFIKQSNNTHTKEEKEMTVNEALQNIDVVVSNARMSRPEHDVLRESLGIVARRCQQADELEKEKMKKIDEEIARKAAK